MWKRLQWKCIFNMVCPILEPWNRPALIPNLIWVVSIKLIPLWCCLLNRLILSTHRQYFIASYLAWPSSCITILWLIKSTYSQEYYLLIHSATMKTANCSFKIIPFHLVLYFLNKLPILIAMWWWWLYWCDYIMFLGKLTHWKAVSLWNKLDKRFSHKEYNNHTACLNTSVLVIGAGKRGTSQICILLLLKIAS